MSTGSLKIKQGATGALANAGYSVLWASTSGMMYLNEPGGITTQLVGTSGTSGVSGSSGTSGVSGSSGTSGVSGSSGSSGTSGVDGSSGTSGNSGSSGSSGTSGVSGSSGTSGVTGVSGTSGTSGVSSPAGLVPGTGTNSMKNDDALVATPAVASGTRSIALGNNACSAGTNSIAIGFNSRALNTSCNNDFALAIGSNVCTDAADTASIVIGCNLSFCGGGLTSRPVVVMGNDMSGTAFGSVVAFGAHNTLNFSVAVFGHDNNVGQSTHVSGIANATGNDNVVIGTSNNTFSKDSVVALGKSNQTKSCNSVVLGVNNSILDCAGTGQHNTIIGWCNTNPSNVANPMSCDTVVGYLNIACGNNFGNSILGMCNTIGSFYSVAVGCGNLVNGDNAVALGNQNQLSEGSLGLGNGNTSSRGYTQMIGFDNDSPGGGQCHVLVGVGNKVYGDDSETANRSANTAVGVCNTIQTATRTHAIGFCNILSDTDGRNSIMLGNENKMWQGATGSSFVGNNNIGATGIPNAYIHGNGITSQVANHFHTTNLFLTAPLGPYVDDAAFYAAGGMTGQAYMIDAGAHTALTIAGFN